MRQFVEIILTLIILSLSFNIKRVSGFKNGAINYELYEEVLDPVQCEKQLSYIMFNDTLLQMKFIDSSFRPPRGILLQNFADWGNYHQCLNINEQVADMSIEGKYAVMNLPLRQDDLQLPTLPEIVNPNNNPWIDLKWIQYLNDKQVFDDDFITNVHLYNKGRDGLQMFFGETKSMTRIAEENPLSVIQFLLAVCLPKVCSLRSGLDIITQNFTSSLDFSETYRLPNDKPWVPADYVAIAIFSIIGFLTLASTSYDIWNTVMLEDKNQKTNKLFMTFSVFTNTRKLFTFKPNPKAITCLDGIRSFAMLWVIVGHTFVLQIPSPANPLDLFNFMTSFSSSWILSAPITVDTFFMISGLLLVYTVAAKLSRMAFLKNIHLFYLNRLLRMFPVLGTAILFEVSFQNWVTDGPMWWPIERNTNNCRQNWWSTLLYVQNYVDNTNVCLSHSWYLAIDMQLYVLSPIVLFWILGGNKLSAWSALISSTLIVMTASTVYIFIGKFPSSLVTLSRPDDALLYLQKYYVMTLTRAAPFLVGMIFGYILHLYRDVPVRIHKLWVGVLWILATVVSSAAIVSPYFVIQPEWNNQTVDSLLNAFIRPAWAVCVAWLVFACHKGYGGPINWVLSLHIFRILGRLSYAMYILHFPLIFLVNATEIAPIYFSVEFSMYRFLTDLSLAILAAVLVSVFIDLPFGSLISLALAGSKSQKSKDPKKNDDIKQDLEEHPQGSTEIAEKSGVPG